MSEDELQQHAAELTTFERHKFMVMVAGTILLSMVMVGIALYLYVASGAESLDLSRPGYRSISKQIEQDVAGPEFSADGSVDRAVVKDFLKQYDEASKKIIDAKSFSGDPLSDQSLQLGQPSS